MRKERGEKEEFTSMKETGCDIVEVKGKENYVYCMEIMRVQAKKQPWLSDEDQIENIWRIAEVAKLI